jgi:hypothetical protein
MLKGRKNIHFFLVLDLLWLATSKYYGEMDEDGGYFITPSIHFFFP